MTTIFDRLVEKCTVDLRDMVGPQQCQELPRIDSKKNLAEWLREHCPAALEYGERCDQAILRFKPATRWLFYRRLSDRLHQPIH